MARTPVKKAAHGKKFSPAEKLVLIGYASIAIAYTVLFVVAFTKLGKAQIEEEQKNKIG